jgi:transposase
MARRILLEPHLTIEELEGSYRSTREPVERSRWHFLWLLARGLTATVIASITGYSAYWIGRIARRYNEHGPEGVKDLRHQSRPSTPLLSASQQDELAAALAAGSAPEGDRWCGWGRTVAAWISQRLGRRVGRQLGWAYLRHLGARLRVPRPRHVRADPRAQADPQATPASAAAPGGDGLPTGNRRAVRSGGRRRTPDRAQADLAQGLDVARSASCRPC